MTKRGMENRPIKGAAKATTVGAATTGLDHVYRLYWSELCGHLNNQFGPGPPDPEDVAQAAFERYAGIKDKSAIANPRAFLYKTACNIVLDHKRREKVIEAYADDALHRAVGIGLEEITPERVLLEKDRLAHVSRVFNRLPAKQKAVLLLKRVHGETFQEISARTGWSMSDCARQLSYALAKIDEALTDLDRRDARDGW